MTMHLMQLLRRSGYIFHTTSEFEIVKKIKEKYCYVAPMNAAGTNSNMMSLHSDYDVYKTDEKS